uniref:Beta-fructofuranosidase n=1 Tax=Physcomitrium patens TaxID=3218 RepID=A0A7I4CHJ8_PHYPA
MYLPCSTKSQFNAVHYHAQREDNSCNLVSVPMLDETSQEGYGLYREVFASRNKKKSAIAFLTIMLIAVVLYTSKIVAPKWLELFQREKQYLVRDIVRNSAITSCHSQPYRSSYHFQPPKNWMNGPMYYEGFYHLFYQYNPGGAVWGNLTWGHAVSTDLIHWRDLEPALKPDEWYDNGGVWSGSVTICPDGSPLILYTGVADDLEQSQNLAVPEDLADPLLRKWVKSRENPILRHPVGIDKEDFRDPTTAWQVNDGTWRILVGAKMGRDGMALLYKSEDLRHWELDENVLHTVPGSGMWECLDFFPIAPFGREGLDTSVNGPHVKHVLKASMYDDQHDHYAVGTYNLSTESFTPINHALDIQHGLHYDYGKFYASKSFYDPVKKRRIVWGWSNESDSAAQDIARGWASLQAIPRVLWLDTALGDSLIQAPIEEVDDLRVGKVSKTDVDLEAGSVIKIEGSSGGQLDIEVIFEYPNVSNVIVQDYGFLNGPFDCGNGGSAQRGVYGPFGLLVLTDDAYQEQTAVFFYIAQDANQRWVTHFCSDQSRSSLLHDIDTTAFWSDVRVLPTENFLSLRVLVDHSIVESFVQGGRMAITSRVYPKEAVDEKAHVFLFNNSTTQITVRSINVWQMRSITVLPLA